MTGVHHPLSAAGLYITCKQPHNTMSSSAHLCIHGVNDLDFPRVQLILTQLDISHEGM
jgi:hypothetical protein